MNLTDYNRAIYLEDGTWFVPTGQPIIPDVMPNIDYLDDRDVVGFVRDYWSRASEAHIAEIGRMRMCELLYSGLHYREPELNRTLQITNFAFGNVETTYPSLTENMPFPVAIPLRPTADPQQTAQYVSEVAHWLQTRRGTRFAYRQNTRTKLKFGHSIHLTTIDPATGMPYVARQHPMDFIFDPSANDVGSCEFFFLPAPQPTRRLQSWYPDMAKWIQQDNFVSPAYEVNKLAMYQHYAPMASTRGTPDLRGSHAYKDGDPTPPTQTTYVLAPPAGMRHTGSPTTYLIQMVVRDYTYVRASLPGFIYKFNPMTRQGEKIAGQFYDIDIPTCPTGWRQIKALPNGAVLENEPVDECFLGLPFVVDYNIEHDGRTQGISEIEQIAPLNRAYNERTNILNRSLRYAGLPMFKIDKGSGINFDRRKVEPGDTLQVNKGTIAEFIQYGGVSPEYFQMQDTTTGMVDRVSGVNDSQRGARPAGIEAGVAIAQLEQADLRRVRAKEPGHLDAWSEVLTKLVSIASVKLRAGAYFRALSGTPRTIDHSALALGWDFTFTKGKLDEASKDQSDQRTLDLADRSFIPPGEALRQIQYPDYDLITAMQQQAAMQAPPPQAGQGGPPK